MASRYRYIVRPENTPHVIDEAYRRMTLWEMLFTMRRLARLGYSVTVKRIETRSDY